MDKSIIDRLQKYFIHQPVKRAWIFGSVSRNEDTEDSDIDILVTFDDNVGLFKYASMIDDLERLLNKTVDIVSESSLFSWVKPSVDKDKILIYERETA